jgi:hypothetical protein
MLHVVHRGCMDDQLTWYPGYADFVQHGQLALLKQAFPRFFRDLSVGLYLNRRILPIAHRAKTALLVPGPKYGDGQWNGVIKTAFGKRHWICSVICTALICEDVMFAHPMTNPDDSDNSATDVPF